LEDTDRKVDTVSIMGEKNKRRRPRRNVPEEFRAEAVRLVLDESKSVMQTAL
jgi:transposase-like protein